MYELLIAFGCMQAAAFLLTGNAIEDTASKGRLLPPWFPASVKVKAGEVAVTHFEYCLVAANICPNILALLKEP